MVKEFGYKKLEIYNLSHKLAIEVHKMSLELVKICIHQLLIF